MKHKVFSVFDAAAGAYLQPFFTPTVGTAIRAIRACLEDSNHPFVRSPGDYTLFEIGEFDDQNGSISVLSSYVRHGSIVEHRAALIEAWRGREDLLQAAVAASGKEAAE